MIQMMIRTMRMTAMTSKYLHLKKAERFFWKICRVSATLVLRLLFEGGK
ncbi:hypothetical protein SAMN02910451_02649 [Butyrivibrio hungatei]|uniref:Uncharacterized protein n=1 Tax=Butyrivibrio hungatei TaxID=185008 RepID=A0A1G5G1W3_9FIRM|nr:hypothetical protein SAMN02910451_02649 [Butyrivibrio hungatei]